MVTCFILIGLIGFFLFLYCAYIRIPKFVFYCCFGHSSDEPVSNSSSDPGSSSSVEVQSTSLTDPPSSSPAEKSSESLAKQDLSSPSEQDPSSLVRQDLSSSKQDSSQ